MKTRRNARFTSAAAALAASSSLLAALKRECAIKQHAALRHRQVAVSLRALLPFIAASAGVDEQAASLLRSATGVRTGAAVAVIGAVARDETSCGAGDARAL